MRGKTRRRYRLPLTCDFGEALTAYLRQVRPPTPIRQVFLASKAPMRAIPPALVSDVTRRACEGAELPRVGAHRPSLRPPASVDLLLEIVQYAATSAKEE